MGAASRQALGMQLRFLHGAPGAGLDVVAVRRPDCLALDTGQASAEDTARCIVRHFGL